MLGPRRRGERALARTLVFGEPSRRVWASEWLPAEQQARGATLGASSATTGQSASPQPIAQTEPKSSQDADPPAPDTSACVSQAGLDRRLQHCGRFATCIIDAVSTIPKAPFSVLPEAAARPGDAALRSTRALTELPMRVIMQNRSNGRTAVATTRWSEFFRSDRRR
jgi:hypothetical protein